MDDSAEGEALRRMFRVGKAFVDSYPETLTPVSQRHVAQVIEVLFPLTPELRDSLLSEFRNFEVLIVQDTVEVEGEFVGMTFIEGEGLVVEDPEQQGTRTAAWVMLGYGTDQATLEQIEVTNELLAKCRREKPVRKILYREADLVFRMGEFETTELLMTFREFQELGLITLRTIEFGPYVVPGELFPDIRWEEIDESREGDFSVVSLLMKGQAPDWSDTEH